MILNPFLGGLLEALRPQQLTLALPESQDPRVLVACQKLLTMGAAGRVLLWGDWERILSLAQQEGVELDPFKGRIDLVNPNDVALEERLRVLFKARQIARGKAASPEELSAFALSPLNQAGVLLHEGACDAVVAGSSATTAEVIRAGLTTLGLSHEKVTVCGAFVMHRRDPHTGAEVLYLFGDSGVVIEPTEAQLVDIGALLVESFAILSPEVEPRVAFLSFSTRGSAKHPRQQRMAAAASAFLSRYPHVKADGELQFDAAIVPAVSQRKCPDSRVEGRANCFVFPDLDSGNIAYKIAQRLGGFAAYGPLLLGLAKPFSDLSRGATAEDIFAVALLSLARAERGRTSQRMGSILRKNSIE